MGEIVMQMIGEEDFKNMGLPHTKQFLNDISQEDKELFLAVYSLYRKLFLNYLLKKTKIKEYDDGLLSSDLKFLKVPVADMDIYQYISHENLGYLYLRNNLYVERLTTEETQFFHDKLRTGNEALDEESEKIIGTTISRVIFEDVMKDGNTYKTNYGPLAQSFMAPNNALVIGIRFDEFNLNGHDPSTWGNLHVEQLKYVFALSDKIEKELTEILGMPAVVIKYDEYSIKKKTVNTKPLSQ